MREEPSRGKRLVDVESLKQERDSLTAFFSCMVSEQPAQGASSSDEGENEDGTNQHDRSTAEEMNAV